MMPAVIFATAVIAHKVAPTSSDTVTLASETEAEPEADASTNLKEFCEQRKAEPTS